MSDLVVLPLFAPGAAVDALTLEQALTVLTDAVNRLARAADGGRWPLSGGTEFLTVVCDSLSALDIDGTRRAALVLDQVATLSARGLVAQGSAVASLDDIGSGAEAVALIGARVNALLRSLNDAGIHSSYTVGLAAGALGSLTGVLEGDVL